MARTTPVSNGWITLVRPVGDDLAGGGRDDIDASEVAQISAMQNAAMIDAAIARPVGEGGVSTISSAAGRNASSSRAAGGAGQRGGAMAFNERHCMPACTRCSVA